MAARIATWASAGTRAAAPERRAAWRPRNARWVRVASRQGDAAADDGAAPPGYVDLGRSVSSS
jgi:hypothetical protein